eukprot:4703232-Amphidinium_carterae.3
MLMAADVGSASVWVFEVACKQVFAQVALGWGFRGLGVASCLDSALAHGGHLRSGTPKQREGLLVSKGERIRAIGAYCKATHVAKLNILNAIAASTTLSGVGFAAWEMSQSCQDLEA